MHFEHQGISLWYGTADTPAPQGELPTDGEISITLAVQPIDASNYVEIQYRVNQGAIHSLPAQWLRNDPTRKTQYFKVRLPVFRSGDTVEYGVICRCAGRQVPDPKQAQILGSSFRLIATTTGLAAEKLSQFPPGAASNSAIATTTPTSSSLLQPNLRSPEQPNIVIPTPLNTSSQPGLPTNQTINGGANPARDRPTNSNPTLAELAHKIGLENQSGLIKALGDQGISTLEDVRKAGGIGNLKNLAGVPNSSVVKILEAHANLSVLSSDWKVNAKLIEKGFTSIDSIAGVNDADFLKALREDLGEAQARQLRIGAGAATGFLNNALVDLATNITNGRPTGLQIAPDILDRLFPNPCHCKDCEAAVSPIAYLADLLEYTIKNLKNNGNAIDLSFLASTFHQPFPDLSANCEAVDKKVLQVRICIEVLRRYMRAHQSDPQIQASAASLSNAEKAYRLNTYISLLNQIGTSYEEIRLTRSGNQQDRTALADRLGIDVSHLDELLLDLSGISTQSTLLTEQKLEELFGLVDTTRNPLFGSPTPLLQTWRLQYLRSLWQQQDLPTDPYNDDFDPAEERLPIIDPDLIGPDDFRHPIPKGTSNAPDRAFDIWLKRREWVDERLQELSALQKIVNGQSLPDLTAMLNRLYQPVNYGAISTTPWSATTPLTDFDTLHEILRGGTKDEVKVNQARIQSDLDLTIDSFNRLQEIRAKNDLAESDPRNQQVTDEEWREVLSILVQVQKVKLSLVWRTEETNANILLDPKEFWFSLREPVAGDWPPASSTQYPLIDPETLQLTDLAELTVGSQAIELWQARQKQLSQIGKDLETTRKTVGFDAMLIQAFGGALPYNIELLNNALSDRDPVVVADAKTKIVTDLHMTVETFRRLLAVKAKNDNPDLQKKPFSSEWLEIYPILVTVHKEIQIFPNWIAEEQAAGRVYWNSLKAKLPSWRSTVVSRQAWQQALHIRSTSPLIDPDLIGPGDLKNPVAGNPAFDLWNRRKRWVNDTLDSLKLDISPPTLISSIRLDRNLPGTFPIGVPAQPSSNNLDRFDRKLGRIIGVFASHLEDLANSRIPGVDLRSRLKQLNLTSGELSTLLRIRHLLANNAAILVSEGEDVDSILLQVTKRRNFAEWRAAEKLAGLTLGSDFFKVLDSDRNYPFPRWRATWRERQSWQETLRSRLDQENSVIETIQEIVRATEEWTLPLLRDALVEAIAPVGSDLPSKAKWVIDYLLIDARVSGCQVTTRVAQAIETIQILIWSVMTGQLKDTYPDLSPPLQSSISTDFEEFEQKWKWLSSYAIWRSAIFVFLYPENILRPSFRKEDQRSHGFQAFLKDLQSKPQLDPGTALEVVKTYQNYYDEINSLQVEASCQVESPRPLTFWFARSQSDSCYWSTYDSQELTGFNQSFWQKIDGLEGARKLIGAVLFRNSTNQNFILLFVNCQQEGSQKLIVVRQDLQSFSCQVKTLITTISFSSIVVVQQQTTDPPILVMKNEEGGISKFWEIQINGDGDDWANAAGNEIEFNPQLKPQWKLLAAVPVYSGRSNPYYLFFQSLDERIWFRVVGDNDHPHLESVGQGTWLGSFPWPSQNQIFAWWMTAQEAEVQVSQFVPPNTLGFDEKHNPQEFREWFNQVTNLDLRDMEIPELGQLHYSTGTNVLQFLYTLPYSYFSSYDSQRQHYSDNGLPLGYFRNSQVFENRPNEPGEIPSYQDSRIRAIELIRQKINNPEDQVWRLWATANELVMANTESNIGIHECLAAFLPFTFPNFSRRSVHVRSQQPPSIVSSELSKIFARQNPSQAGITGSLAIASGISPDINTMILAYKNNQSEWLRGLVDLNAAGGNGEITAVTRIVLKDDESNLSSQQREARKLQPVKSLSIRDDRLAITGGLVLDHQSSSASLLIYLAEFYYFVAVQIALQLQRSGYFEEALRWFRLVYDYAIPEANRKVWFGLVIEQNLPTTFEYAVDFFLDPIDPHRIAATRCNTYTRFMLQALVRCFLDYADAEFTRDTAESVPRARILYLTALELLDSEYLKQKWNPCEALIGTRDNPLADEPGWETLWGELIFELRLINDPLIFITTVQQVRVTLKSNTPPETRFSQARALITKAQENKSVPILATVLEKSKQQTFQAHSLLLSEPDVSKAANLAANAASTKFLQSLATSSDFFEASTENQNPDTKRLYRRAMVRGEGLAEALAGSGTSARTNAIEGGLESTETSTNLLSTNLFSNWIPSGHVDVIGIPGLTSPRITQFCIPPNPIVTALRHHAELNLEKIRSCRNIAGMARQIDIYTAPIDTQTGIPTEGTLLVTNLLGTTSLHPTPYRYPVLIERAKDLARQAAQIESTMLNALQQGDSEAYQLLQARQGIELASAQVRVQALRIQEALSSVNLARLQQSRSQIQSVHYKRLLDEGLSWKEQLVLDHTLSSAIFFTAATALGLFDILTLDFSSSVKNAGYAEEQWANWFSQSASYERRSEEWQLQLSLAHQDVQIGSQQIASAQTQVSIATEERNISNIRVRQAGEILDFLNNKFTNVELYEWMSDVLAGVYRFFLQQTTAMAQLAAGQLAFERQQILPISIQSDYWQVIPNNTSVTTAATNDSDRRGLTGSARLLQDIYQLDQYAFETNKRKLQLTKTISLAQLDPFAFQQFRETGVLLFNTPMQLFDRDFPGHHLRLIQRVRTSVIALIPPVQGIHATLSTTGLSRVVIGPDVFQTVIVRRTPESVALTAPQNATGLFELQQQSEMLLPFEGMGVDTSWEFRMPKAANPFDYSTIADVLIAIDYTALDSYDYRQQVIQEIDTRLSGDRPFSFRNQFADAWYDLHNPEQTTTPMTVSFQIVRADFPPNIESLKIQQIVLYFARSSEQAFEIPVTQLRFTEQGSQGSVGGGATSTDGIISTRRGNAGSWTTMIGKSPIGTWELALPNTEEVRNRFQEEAIEDILFVITYSGQTPDWPV